jgi:sugar phosphate isomerase/epimerase
MIFASVSRPRLFSCFVALLALLSATLSAQTAPDIFDRVNLVAWCIVPFDTKKRGPEERAQMLDRLGIKRLAYDYRAEHIPTWDAELDALKLHGIELTAWWFPASLNDEAKQALDLFRRHGVKPQLWITGGGAPAKDAAEQTARVETEAQRVRSIAEAAVPLGCAVALYNHGGWFGEPENQLAIIERLARDGVRNVGIVYNFHHGHDHLDRFAELWRQMQPHLLAVNLNGMVRDGDKLGKKIIPLGSGTEELGMLRVIRESGWRGPVGILNHRPEVDAEEALRGNLAGLERLVAELESQRTQRAAE